METQSQKCRWVEEDLCSACADREKAVHKVFDEEVNFILDKFDKVITASNPFAESGMKLEATLSKDQLLSVYGIAAMLARCRIRRNGDPIF